MKNLEETVNDLTVLTSFCESCGFILEFKGGTVSIKNPKDPESVIYSGSLGYAMVFVEGFKSGYPAGFSEGFNHSNSKEFT